MPDVTREEFDQLMARVRALEDAQPTTYMNELAIHNKAIPKTRGHRLPDDQWMPRPETIGRMAHELGVDSWMFEAEHHKFIDYWLSVPGQRGVKLDWERTWCNWMRAASERGTLRSVTPSRMDQKVQGWQEIGRNAASGQ